MAFLVHSFIPKQKTQKAVSCPSSTKTEVHYQAAKAATPPLPDVVATPLAPVAAALAPAKEVPGIVASSGPNGRKTAEQQVENS